MKKDKRKTTLVNFRINNELLQDFKRVAEIQGLSMSALLHQYVTLKVLEMKDRYPHLFFKDEA